MPLDINGQGSISGITSLNTSASVNLSETELGYLDGVTSGLQGQVNTKLSTPSSWSLFNPTWTNLTVGNGINEMFWVKTGSIVHVRANFIFGSTTTISGIFFPSLPVSLVGFAQGSGWAFDSSATAWNNIIFSPANYFVGDGGLRLNATSPWTWAVNDIIRFSMTYEAA